MERRLNTSPWRTVRLTPLRICCFDSAMTAERSLTSSKTLGESSPRSVADDDGDSTLRVHRTAGRQRRRGDKKEMLFLRERSGEVEEQVGLKRAIGTSSISGNRLTTSDCIKHTFIQSFREKNEGGRSTSTL